MNRLISNDGVVIVDAGGGTIDVSAYSRTSNTARQFFEGIAQPQCEFPVA
jgi:cell division ATPase FtsA